MNVAGLRIHCMGAGGVGVSALAELAYRRGAVVSGCDLHENDLTRRLVSLGVPVAHGHAPGHLDDVQLLVYSAAVGPDNPERRAAEERRIRTMRRGVFLARLLEDDEVFGVCGTHGKTTTTWLLGQLLDRVGRDPTILLGGVGAGETGNLHVGESHTVVVELDESDESFLEPSVRLALVTNVEADHLDHYGSPQAVTAAFARFAEGVAQAGVLVAGVDDPGARALAEAHPGATVRTGLAEDADVRAEEVRADGLGQTFTLHAHGARIGPCQLNLPGEHNVKNALLALAAAHAVGVDWCRLCEVLPACRPVGRRFEVVGEAGGVVVVDDYAHHPTEITATLTAARRVYPDRRLLAVFQPHLYSRTQFLAEAFGQALAAADAVVLADIYPAREKPIPGVDSGLVTAATRMHNPSVTGPFPKTRLAGHVAQLTAPGDVVLFLGAGDVGACAGELLDRL